MENKVKLKDYFEFGVNEPKRRIAYNRDDVNFKLKIIRKMQELGMKITIDKIGNISGTLEGNNKSNKCILMASHTDSVKDGGQYDGPVGVISGLKVVEDIVDKVNRNEIDLDCNLKLVIWACEESERFGKACIGSKWVEGSLNDKDFTIKEVLKKPENEKRTLQEAVQEYITDIKNEGLPNIEYVDKVITMDEILKAYEIHIEQYQYLYENDIDIGIISSIVAPYRMSVEILGKDKIKSAANLVIKMNEKAKEAEKESKYRATIPVIDIKQDSKEKRDYALDVQLIGETAHSGATPMTRRKDAVLTASKIVLKLNELIKKENYDFDVFIDEISCTNTSMNKVSGDAKLRLGINTNGLSEEIITQILENLVQAVAGQEGLKVTLKKIDKIELNNSKKETNNIVKIDVRMQEPVKPADMFEEISSIVTEIADETGDNFYCKKTDKAEPIATNKAMQQKIVENCNKDNISCTIMPSWAGHDVAHLGIQDKMLLFIKSTGGSHNPEENTTEEDIEKGITVLRNCVEDNIEEIHEIVEYVENSMNKTEISKEETKTLLEKMGTAKKMGISVPKRIVSTIRKNILAGKLSQIDR